ncbi:MAG: sporulation protein [Firmicutes bacterium]|nr:sporulation protein [Bacillota bacterium]
MSDNIAENITKTIVDAFREMAKTETVVGKPFKVNEYTVVPVSKVSMGFGSGGSFGKQEKEEMAGGGGGGMSVEPLAFLVSYGNEVNLLNLGKGKGLEAVFECMPAVISQTGEAIKSLVVEAKKKDAPEKEEDK